MFCVSFNIGSCNSKLSSRCMHFFLSLFSLNKFNSKRQLILSWEPFIDQMQQWLLSISLILPHQQSCSPWVSFLSISLVSRNGLLGYEAFTSNEIMILLWFLHNRIIFLYKQKNKIKTLKMETTTVWMSENVSNKLNRDRKWEEIRGTWKECGKIEKGMTSVHFILKGKGGGGENSKTGWEYQLLSERMNPGSISNPNNLTFGIWTKII